MNTSTVRRSVLLSTAVTAALLSAGGAEARSAVALEAMSARAAAAVAELPNHAKRGSGVSGVLNPGSLTAPALSLTLADGRVLTAVRTRLVRNDAKGTITWLGTFPEQEGSIAVLSKVKGVVTGFATINGETLEIMPSAAGKHVLYAVDSAKLPSSNHRPRKVIGGGALADGTDYATGGTVAAAGNGVIQDVLVVYTAASATRHGAATLEGMIQSAVQTSNQAYLNSGVGITLNLVGTQQVSLTEKGSMESTLSAATSDAEIKGLRDRMAADLVMVVSQDSNWCGYAWIMGSNSTGFAPNAYGAMNSGCLSNNTFVHELGHIQGLNHDRESSAGGGAYPYAFGYRRCMSDGTGFREIMAYPCSGVPLVWQFSSPNLYYNGYAIGVSYEASPSTSAEAVRTLNNTAATVAAFRGSSSTPVSGPPAAPTSLATSSVASSSVGLVWADGSSNETGFKIERSADGVNFTEAAGVGTDVVRYTDSSVAALSSYFYRVRAYNSSGVSGYSNTVRVSTPETPPPPPAAPSIVNAGNNGDGTATVSWAGVTNATAYEVQRETWDSRKQVWGRATIAAKVPSNTLSLVDASGTGDYRYSVRASNAGGNSGLGGPARVTVTGSKKRGR